MRESLIWMFSGQGMLSAMQILVLMVLGRLLTQHEFGTITIFLAIAQICGHLATLGYGPALVQHQGTTSSHISTALTVALLGGLITGITIYLLRRPLLQVFQLEAAEPLSLFFIPLCLVSGLNLVLRSLMQKQGQFRWISAVEAGSFLVAYLVPAITLAALGFGAASVIVAFSLNLAVNITVFWARLRPPLRSGFQLRSARELSRTGLGFGLSEFVSIASQNLDKLTVGSLLGPAAVGLYGRAHALMLSAVHILTAPLDAVLFPAFSEAQQHAPKLRDLLAKTQVLAMLLGLPIALLMVCEPKGIILVMLGPNWTEAAPLLQVFALLLLVRVNGRAVDFIPRAKGLVYKRLLLTVAFTVFTVVFILIGARFGLIGVAAGVTAAFLCHGSLVAWLAIREVGISWREFLSFLVRPFAWGGLVGGLALLVKSTWVDSPLHPLAELGVIGTVLALAFGTCVWLRPTLVFGRHGEIARLLISSLMQGRLRNLDLEGKSTSSSPGQAG